MVIRSSGVFNSEGLFIYTKEGDELKVNNQPDMTNVAVNEYNANKDFLFH